jgi:hypothetical protein
MNGPDHYRKAEECAIWAHKLLLLEEGSQDAAAAWAAIAQAHATLAHTAAIAGTKNQRWEIATGEVRPPDRPTPTQFELGTPTRPPWQPPASPPQIMPLCPPGALVPPLGAVRRLQPYLSTALTAPARNSPPEIAAYSSIPAW